jgi:DNA-binding IscR family transcriptional regulator
MKRDGRLSNVLHALLHMAEAGAPMTSAELAVCMSTNPVVVRRTMAGLREAGLVSSAKGHGGGWEIACDLEAVTLKDVHAALGSPALMAAGLSLGGSECLVEQAVNRALGESFEEAERMLVQRLGEVTLARLANDFRREAKRRREGGARSGSGRKQG